MHLMRRSCDYQVSECVASSPGPPSFFNALISHTTLKKLGGPGDETSECERVCVCVYKINLLAIDYTANKSFHIAK